MEKKYRIKEELKKFFNFRSELLIGVFTEKQWLNNGVSLEALEEVEERIKIDSIDFGSNNSPNMKAGEVVKLCEAILNAPKETQDAFMSGYLRNEWIKQNGEWHHLIISKTEDNTKYFFDGRKLLDIESLDDEDFNEWYTFNPQAPSFSTQGIKAVLTQYLKQKEDKK